MSAKNTPEKFWARVRRAGANDCWLWLGSRVRGYGSLKYRGESWKAHRLAWKLTHGAIPDCVLHRCDNPPCCNPNHLFLGTQLDNALDREAKGRCKNRRRGARNGNAKLTDSKVRLIKNSAQSSSELAQFLGVHKSTIKKIRSGNIWAHIK